MEKNLYYFNYSAKNPEEPLCESFIFLEKDEQLEKYADQTKKIKEYLITIKIMLENQSDQSEIDPYFRQLQKLLNKFSNRSEFICFAHACDTTLEVLQNDFELLKKISKLYIEKRDITQLTPMEWIQALIDSQSSRRKGSAGEKKLIEICKRAGFVEASNWEDFYRNSSVVAAFKKSSKSAFSLNTVRKKLGIDLRMNDPNKAPDLLMKKDRHWYILEAKHLNASGGEQNKQIQELIHFISIEERKQDIHYVAFVDGIYSNVLFQEKNPGSNTHITKLAMQQKAIKKNLNEHPNNFWLNSAGFSKWIKDI